MTSVLKETPEMELLLYWKKIKMSYFRFTKVKMTKPELLQSPKI